MSKSITQDMAYRQSLMRYAEKYGVSRASRKYNKSQPYIYFWKARWDGTPQSLGCQSRRPHSHSNQHTDAELKLILYITSYVCFILCMRRVYLNPL